MLDNYLNGVVAQDIYEETDVGFEKKLSEIKAQLNMLGQQRDEENDELSKTFIDNVLSQNLTIQDGK